MNWCSVELYFLAEHLVSFLPYLLSMISLLAPGATVNEFTTFHLTSVVGWI